MLKKKFYAIYFVCAFLVGNLVVLTSAQSAPNCEVRCVKTYLTDNEKIDHLYNFLGWGTAIVHNISISTENKPPINYMLFGENLEAYPYPSNSIAAIDLSNTKAFVKGGIRFNDVRSLNFTSSSEKVNFVTTLTSKGIYLRESKDFVKKYLDFVNEKMELYSRSNPEIPYQQCSVYKNYGSTEKPKWSPLVESLGEYLYWTDPLVSFSPKTRSRGPNIGAELKIGFLNINSAYFGVDNYGQILPPPNGGIMNSPFMVIAYDAERFSENWKVLPPQFKAQFNADKHLTALLQDNYLCHP
ncbi:MAG: hypothetical protein QE271_00575 [Bacteriovoracaceae bacterium]|nr:hypothetical protein [Bacteriovoracaceae bacterium]